MCSSPALTHSAAVGQGVGLCADELPQPLLYDLSIVDRKIVLLIPPERREQPLHERGRGSLIVLAIQSKEHAVLLRIGQAG